MLERIRYTFGTSSLGRFVVGSSDAGLVAFEFEHRGVDLLAVLLSRFPVTAIEQDDDGLSTIAGKLRCLVDHPDQQLGIALDPRGTSYQSQVWNMLRDIPAGETTHYGALAAELGTRDARDVTEAIGANSIAILIPCHRVVKKDGSIAGYRWGARRKQALLARERHVKPFCLL